MHSLALKSLLRTVVRLSHSQVQHPSNMGIETPPTPLNR